MNAPHCPPCIGPPVHMLLACFSALSEIARNEGVLDEASGEDLASMLEDGRLTRDVSEISTDLGQIT